MQPGRLGPETSRASLLDIFQSPEWRWYFLTHTMILAVAIGTFRLVAHMAGIFGVSLGSWKIAWPDVYLYFDWSSKIFSGRIPYRDFDCPYPPVALLLYLLPRLGTSSFGGYLLLYSVQMLLLNGVLLALILRECRNCDKDPRESFRWYLAFTAPQALMLVWRMDIAVALICFWGYTEWSRGRSQIAALLLGAGTMLKLVPAVVFGSMVLPLFRTRRGSAIQAATVFGSMCLTIGLAWLAIGGTRSGTAVLTHANRGIEFGSTYAGLLMLWAKITKSTVTIVGQVSCDCMEVVGLTAANAFLKGTSTMIAAAAYCVFAWFSLTRERIDLLRWCSLSLIIFMITFKVLSPQYLIWTAPFLCMIRGTGCGLIRTLYLASCILTAVIFPFGFNYVIAQSLWMVLCLNLRNLLLVACAIQLARHAMSSSVCSLDVWTVGSSVGRVFDRNLAK